MRPLLLALLVGLAAMGLAQDQVPKEEAARLKRAVSVFASYDALDGRVRTSIFLSGNLTRVSFVPGRDNREDWTLSVSLSGRRGAFSELESMDLQPWGLGRYNDRARKTDRAKAFEAGFDWLLQNDLIRQEMEFEVAKTDEGWRLLMKYFPEVKGGWGIVVLDERFRFVRLIPGE